MTKDETRFWSKVPDKPVDPDACWEWGASIRNGYGSFGLGGKKRYAHRVSYILCCGSISPELDVLHTCDNPKCVRPGHLIEGTHTDNMRDMIAKGRGNKPRGEQNGFSKINEKVVREVREKAENGSTQRELALTYGVSQTNISSIVLRKTWGHV